MELRQEHILTGQGITKEYQTGLPTTKPRM